MWFVEVTRAARTQPHQQEIVKWRQPWAVPAFRRDQSARVAVPSKATALLITVGLLAGKYEFIAKYNFNLVMITFLFVQL